MTREEISTEIVTLAAKYASADPDDLRPETRLFSDLHLDGDQAAGFMAAFTNRFGPDMSGFYWLRYFSDEGMDMLSPALVALAQAASPAFAAQWRAAKAEEREITLAHLTDVAEAGAWAHPGAEHAPRRKPQPLAAVFIWTGVASLVGFCAFALVALYGLATGALGEATWISAAAVIAAAALPFFLSWISWRNIKRKLASAP